MRYNDENRARWRAYASECEDGVEEWSDEELEAWADAEMQASAEQGTNMDIDNPSQPPARQEHLLVRYLRRVLNVELEHTDPDPDGDGFSEGELAKLKTDLGLLLGQLEQADVDQLIGKGE